jgi:hypothetical protein
MPSPTSTSQPTLRPRRARYWLTPAILAALSCRGGEPTGVLRSPGGFVAAKGGGSAGGSGSASLSVTSTSPAQAPQDTALDVTINGSGFTSGARATWSLNGDTTLVHVQSTKFVGSTQLIAHLLVPSTAPVASYDVQVTLTSGKKGVGAELFAVTPADPKAEFLLPLDATGLGVSSDGFYVSGDQSVYRNQVCGVDSKIFATTEYSNSGDAVMQTDNPKYTDNKCVNYPRKVLIDYGDGTTPQWTTVFFNVGDIERDNDPADQIPIGTSRLRALHINDVRCGGLVYQDHIAGGAPTGADSVIVSRTAVDTWVVTTQPAPNDRAYCKADAQLYHIPVRLTVVRLAP